MYGVSIMKEIKDKVFHSVHTNPHVLVRHCWGVLIGLHVVLVSMLNQYHGTLMR